MKYSHYWEKELTANRRVDFFIVLKRYRLCFLRKKTLNELWNIFLVIYPIFKAFFFPFFNIQTFLDDDLFLLSVEWWKSEIIILWVASELKHSCSGWIVFLFFYWWYFLRPNFLERDVLQNSFDVFFGDHPIVVKVIPINKNKISIKYI